MRTTPPQVQENNKGSVLIITIIISSVLFTIGIALSSILEKEIVRQQYSEQSQRALNIANTAFECTLYNDFRRHSFEHTTFNTGSSFNCGAFYQVRSILNWEEEYVAVPERVGTSPNTVYRFAIIASSEINIANKSLPCAHVEIHKQCVGESRGATCVDGIFESSIEVKGYDLCTSGDVTNQDLVRRFRVYY